MQRDTLGRLERLEAHPAAAGEAVAAETIGVAPWVRSFFFRELDVDATTGRIVAQRAELAEVAAALNAGPVVLLSDIEGAAFLEAAAAGALRMAWVTQGPTVRHYSPWPAWPADGAAYPEGHTELCSAVYKAAHIWARQTGNPVPGELSGALADVVNWLTAPDRVFLAED